jgi:hypothetical protein
MLVLLVTLGGCGESSSDFEPVAPEDMVASGSWYAREAWPHDGQPYESAHFVVYSDAAAPDAREATAEIAENLWSDLLIRFDVDEAELVFPAGRDRIDIYVYKNRYPERWGMRAYQAGLIAWSLDHDRRSTDRDGYAPVVEHELVHVLETLLKGRDSTIEPMVDTWFSEGLAEAVAGGTSGGPVRGRDQLSNLLAAHDGQNPIALKRDSMYEADNDFHYPMFQLAVEYLLDPQGGGRSLEDARDLFLDMADGTTFEEAFGRHMGMPLDRYEAEFFALVDGYLPAYRNPFFSPLGIALLVVLVVGVPSTVLVISGRRNRREATALARAGFYASTGLGGLLAVAATLGILIVLGTAGNLYNEAETTGRHIASWVIALYLGAALGALVWVQRRWGRGSRLAFLGLPLVLLLFGLSVAAAGLVL